MSDLIKKRFLDEAGLALYDELIKEYIDSANDQGGAALTAEKERAEAAEKAIIESLVELGNKVGVEKLDEGETVMSYIDKSIADLVNSAPETFDTLKEIADWIQSPEGGQAFDAANRIVEAEQAIEDLKVEMVENDLDVYNAIISIEDLKIAALFPVMQAEDQTAAQAIAEVEEGKAVKLTADQTIAEDLTIEKSCYVDANGSTFTGTVTVPADAEVVIENAIFANPVVVA